MPSSLSRMGEMEYYDGDNEVPLHQDFHAPAGEFCDPYVEEMGVSLVDINGGEKYFPYRPFDVFFFPGMVGKMLKALRPQHMNQIVTRAAHATRDVKSKPRKYTAAPSPRTRAASTPPPTDGDSDFLDMLVGMRTTLGSWTVGVQANTDQKKNGGVLVSAEQFDMPVFDNGNLDLRLVYSTMKEDGEHEDGNVVEAKLALPKFALGLTIPQPEKLSLRNYMTALTQLELGLSGQHRVEAVNAVVNAGFQCALTGVTEVGVQVEKSNMGKLIDTFTVAVTKDLGEDEVAISARADLSAEASLGLYMDSACTTCGFGLPVPKVAGLWNDATLKARYSIPTTKGENESLGFSLAFLRDRYCAEICCDASLQTKNIFEGFSPKFWVKVDFFPENNEEWN